MKNRRRNTGNGEPRSRRVEVRGATSSSTGTGGSRNRDYTRHGAGRIQPHPHLSTDWPTGRELMSYPVDMLRRFRHDMDRFFEDIAPMRSGPRQTMMSVWSPRTEMFDREGKLVVRVELPGLEKDDVKVLVSNDSLVIEGERRQSEEEHGRGYYESEWTYGRFYREIPLPESVEPSEVKASFTNGVLEIALPQPQNLTERREVPIQS